MFNSNAEARIFELLSKLDERDGMLVQSMLNEIERLQKKVKEQDKRISDYSWTVNPDRMGGQFSRDEIDRSRNGGW